MTTISLGELIRVFTRIGVLSFGGPAAQIALMHRELVERRSWLDEAGFLRALSLCMLLPGPEAMQLATYAGWRLRGIPGGLLAGLLFVLPGALVIAALFAIYVNYGTQPLVQAGFNGIKAAVIVIVFQALLKLSAKALHTPLAWGLAGGAFFCIFALNLPFPIIIAGAAVIGYMQAADSRRTATPKLPRFPWAISVSFLALWLLPLALLSLAGAPLLAETGWFFAQLAVVTFGGAYAVLAYMTQVVVQDFGWITTTQMIDALGLAETTPGPLILVTQFVAMLSGHSAGGAALAIAAGGVALWATFMPCFLWIFAAGPYVEHLENRPRLAAALQAISAAVVGVILNLSVWFALHVLFADVTPQKAGPINAPLPDWTSFEPKA
ncbi:MAG: chromate efflux transporter, partial [Arenibacterium sp.]